MRTHHGRGGSALSANKPRFLAPLGKPRDYVDNPAMAVPGEPECIGPAILDGYSEAAAFQYSLQHQKAVEDARNLRPQLAAEDRLKDIQRRAKATHCDLSHEIHIMRRDLERARAGGRKTPGRVLSRLERIESVLDCVDADGFPRAA